MAGKLRETIGGDLGDAHEINVTPFIDVMLVLRVIFMVAAPLATVDINVDLPASSAAAAPRPVTPMFLTVKRDRTVSLGNSAPLREGFAAALGALTSNDPETRILLRADKALPYGGKPKRKSPQERPSPRRRRSRGRTRQSTPALPARRLSAHPAGIAKCVRQSPGAPARLRA